MKYGSQVAKVEDRGKLVISRWLAEQVAYANRMTGSPASL